MRYIFSLIVLLFVTTSSFSQNTPQAAAKRRANAQEELREIVKETREYLPLQLDEATRWTEILISDKALTYKYIVNESEVALSSINTTEMKSYLKNQVAKNHEMANCYWDLVVLKKNLVYLWVGSKTRSSRSVTITYDELRKLRNFSSWL